MVSRVMLATAHRASQVLLGLGTVERHLAGKLALKLGLGSKL